ncbi:hypothetical protein [Paenibacillus chitinolyticus]|uniref:Uncharacterized protein n=1 Tax=Paenibacillus chitinolyticus TaxID=79263 RepID=A0ABT4FNE7_9BACL|nr:hypothetical protein [Paenibacillus chitinolyticus]MCY9591417.1 hypothetical protein [Paenibacillus chitinolyticus]MCY9599406.1 hypothetical protein [Paenibacillus chitinolyticus]
MKKRASPGLAGPGGSVQPGSGGTTGGSVEYQTGYDGLAVRAVIAVMRA